MKILATLASLLIACTAMAAETQPGQVVLTKENTITINDIFDSASVAPLIKQAKDMDARLPSKDPIYLVLNSPGGSIKAGMELVENLNSLKRPVHTVTIFSASMGFHTVQQVKGERLVLSNGTLMSHRPRGVMFGEFPGQLDTRYQHTMRFITRMDEQVIKRTGGKYNLNTYHDLIRDEFWCDGQDCVDKGMADRVVNVTCDKSLDGINTISILQTIVYGHTLEITADMDNCPTNTEALKYTILVDGAPLFANDSRSLLSRLNFKADATGNPTANIKPYDPFNLVSQSYSSSYYDTDKKVNLTKEELYEIQQRADAAIKARENRDVVKSY